MIIIQTEAGAIVTDPKEIYIDKDLDGHLHIYAGLVQPGTRIIVPCQTER